jgi:hypothetical protein
MGFFLDSDAQMTTQEFSAVEGPWVRSENEGRGGLQQQRSERFYLYRMLGKMLVTKKAHEKSLTSKSKF